MPQRRTTARDRARRELGQNFLVRNDIAQRVAAVLDPAEDAPVVELGAGTGALTRHLVATGRPVTAVELDPHWAERLRRTFPDVHVVRCDMRRFRFPAARHVIAGNLPFAITATMTRRLLATSGWSEAALLLQWEVARKRAQGGTMLGAQWAPWFDFRLHGRVSAESFRPVPAVDGGLLHIRRRPRPLLPHREVDRYQRFVAAVFTGRGRGIAEIVGNLTGRRPRDVPRGALPRDLRPEDWARLYVGSL
ncbi:23S ribosomal RNA methyltransferase Erm [Saccharopolyspora rosea]|uniref:23S ribosomal RNA methyltransferase Erm n=1 Tax=Saccharopolyspora rosea TaxID=524884 RepID=A0ABW3FI79_9PSEU|nr:23S ribosomal RNA methyltransferase Erm [Saccharopolyspora rosea]